MSDGTSIPLARGLSALGWRDILGILTLIAGASVVTGFAVWGSAIPGIAGFSMVAVSSAVAFGANFARRRRVPNERREIAHGYTTLFHRHLELPQVEPRSGAVIRRAGERFLPRRRERDFITQANPVRRPNPLRGRWVFLALLVIGPLLMLSIGLRDFEVGTTIAFVVALPVGGLLMIGAVENLRAHLLADAQRAAPDSRVFWLDPIPELLADEFLDAVSPKPST